MHKMLETVVFADNLTTGVLLVAVFLYLTRLVNIDCVQRSGLPAIQMTTLHLDLSDSGDHPQR